MSPGPHPDRATIIGAALAAANANVREQYRHKVNGTVSLETRVDQSRGGEFHERIGAVWAEMAYTAWRALLAQPQPVLAVLLDEASCRAAARRWRMRDVTLRQLLGAALDEWPDCFADAQARVDHEDLAYQHRRLS